MSKVDKPDQEYVLGTDDGEIDRLGLQHRVWSEHAQAAWSRAGFKRGDRIADIGCGPGFATVELVHLTGPDGVVAAFEISDRFLASARSRLEAAGLEASLHKCDLDELELEEGGFDAIWCRWVASFVSQPRRLAGQIARGLAPGGVAVTHEYLHYGTWRLLPRVREFEELVELIQESWRASGGEPDIATSLPAWLEEEGLEVELRPLQFAARRGDPMWEWPAAFVRNSLVRLQRLGLIEKTAAARIEAAWSEAEGDPATRMVTPCVGEIIARKPAA